MALSALSGKTAVVTGGTRGIGLMIARGGLGAGARVYISSRKANACAAAEQELRQYGPVAAIPAALSAEEDCLRLPRAIGKRGEAMPILAHTADPARRAPPAVFPASAWAPSSSSNIV